MATLLIRLDFCGLLVGVRINRVQVYQFLVYQCMSSEPETSWIFF